jgi:KUP system potassium uptake protein
MLKVLQGGYVPLLIAAFLSLLMFTWVRGTKILYKSSQRHEIPLLELVKDLKKELPHITEGNAVFLTSDRTIAPASLVHNLTHNKVMHEKNIILTITTRGLPRIPASEKVIVHKVSDHFWQVEIQFGFMESPNVRKALPLLKKYGISLENDETSFFLSRRSVRASTHFGMDFWQDKLYILLHRNASDASVYYNIPCSRVVEVGTQMRV